MLVIIVLIIMLFGIIIYISRSGEASSHPAEDGRIPETYRRAESRPRNGNTVDEAQGYSEL